MNKAELISAVAEKTGLSKKDTEAALNAALEAITQALAQEVWANLNEDNKVSLFVQYIDLASGGKDTVILNKHQ